MSFVDLARRLMAERPNVEARLVPLPSPGPEAEPLAPPAPRPLPEPPRRGGPPVLLDVAGLGEPGSPAAECDADFRAALTRAREGYARHGGAPGGREAHRFVRDAATLECLILTREREFARWRERWRACLEGVYAGRVALLPSFEAALLATWRPAPAEGEGAPNP